MWLVLRVWLLLSLAGTLLWVLLGLLFSREDDE